MKFPIHSIVNIRINTVALLQFGDSQKLRLVRILRSTVMVRVGGGWVGLDEFLVKNDPCRGEAPWDTESLMKYIKFPHWKEGSFDMYQYFKCFSRKLRKTSETNGKCFIDCLA